MRFLEVFVIFQKAAVLPRLTHRTHALLYQKGLFFARRSDILNSETINNSCLEVFMSRPESREIYQIAKMHMKLTPAVSRANCKFSHIEYEYSSAFDMEFMITLPCHVLYISKYKFDKGFVFTNGNIDAYDLFVIYGGQVEYRHKDIVFQAQAGDALYINSALQSAITQRGDEPLELLMLRLSGLSPMNYYDLISKNRTEPIHLSSPEKLDALLGKIVYYMKYPTNQNNVLMVDTMSGIFTELYLSISGDLNRDMYYNHPQWFIDTINYIEKRSLSNVQISKIAEELGMSESHFHKIFREYTGTTPYQYLLGLRIKSAQSLLASTDHQIKYISYTVGFNSVNHFITHFKKEVGCTPAEYRTQKQKDMR